MIKRLLKYLLLGVLTTVTPYILTMLFILVTGDRIEGMKMAAIPGLVLPHLVFGYNFIERPLIAKLLLSCLVTAAVCGLLFVIIQSELIKTDIDMYGFWDLAISNFIAGLIAWEIFYHIDKSIPGKRS